VISVIIPFLNSPQLFAPAETIRLNPIFQSHPVLEETIPTAVSAEAVQPSKAASETIQTNEVSFKTIFLSIYLSGVFISFLILFYSFISVLLLFRKARKVSLDGIRLMIIADDIPAFSFGRYILISQHDYDTNPEAIITHERSHIRMGHFYDLMLMELAKVIFWFNPLVYRLARDLKEIHEFQADHSTLHSGIDATQYQLLIIQKCVGHQKFALANSFNHCQIKNRIVMMNKHKTSKAWRWKVATFLPLLALLLMAFGKSGENVTEKVKVIVKESVPEKIIAPSETIQIQNEQTSRLIEIRKDGNYIDNKKLSLKEIVKKGQEWAKASNDWIHLQIDESVPYGSIDEIREGLEAAKVYHVTQSTVNSDEIIYPAGDVSALAKFTQGSWDEWLQNRLEHSSEGKSKILQYKIRISFIVDKKGKVRDAHIVKPSEHPEINAAMEKVLAQVPDWIPAKRLGEPVSVLAHNLLGNKGMNDERTGALHPTIFIDVKKDGIFLMKELVSLDELKKRLPSFNENYSEQTIFVRIGVGASQNQVESVKKIFQNSGELNVKYSTDFKEKDFPSQQS
jgi:biopolymer transport protein ExbD